MENQNWNRPNFFPLKVQQMETTPAKSDGSILFRSTYLPLFGKPGRTPLVVVFQSEFLNPGAPSRSPLRNNLGLGGTSPSQPRLILAAVTLVSSGSPQILCFWGSQGAAFPGLPGIANRRLPLCYLCIISGCTTNFILEAVILHWEWILRTNQMLIPTRDIIAF